jgi:hypothetical protein
MKLSQWLAELSTTQSSTAEKLADGDAEGLRRHLHLGLEEAANVLVEACRGRPGGMDLLPISLTKRVLIDHGRCEGLALAHLGGDAEEDPTWEMLRGTALDRFVKLWIHGGETDDPIGDVLAMLRAEGREHESAVLEGSLDDHRREDLLGLAESASELQELRALDARVEVFVGVELADGAVRLPGRIDVLSGGPGTSRPAAAIEVKSGRSERSQIHTGEVHHYAMLCSCDTAAPQPGSASGTRTAPWSRSTWRAPPRPLNDGCWT